MELITNNTNHGDVKYPTKKEQDEYLQEILNAIGYDYITPKDFIYNDGLVVYRRDGEHLAEQLETINKIPSYLLNKLKEKGVSNKFHLKYRDFSDSVVSHTVTKEPVFQIQTNNSELLIEIPLTCVRIQESLKNK